MQDAIAGYHALRSFVVDWVVERVRHGANELLRRIARQLCIGVQSNHVFHAGQNGGVAHHQRKAAHTDTIHASQHAGAEEGVQLGQFAAFALIPHPDFLFRIPAPGAVEEEE